MSEYLDKYKESIKLHSIETLEDILNHIDREKFKDRYEAVFEELKLRKNEKKPLTEEIYQLSSEYRTATEKVEVFENPKKRSNGITIFALLMFLIAIGCIMSDVETIVNLTSPIEKKMQLLEMPVMKGLGINSITKLDRYYKVNLITSIFLLIPALALFIGLFKLKKWARFGIIIISGFFIFTIVHALLFLKKAGLVEIIGMFVFSAAIYFFTRPKIKEQFKCYTKPKTLTTEIDTKGEKSILWKVYFWFIIFSVFFGYLSTGISRFWELLDMLIFAISIIGLFAFIWRKKILTLSFWKAVLPMVVIWQLIYGFLIPMPEK